MKLDLQEVGHLAMMWIFFSADLCFHFFFKLDQEIFKSSHPNHACVTGHMVPPTTTHLLFYYLYI